MANKRLRIKVKAAYDAAVRLYWLSRMEVYPEVEETSALYQDAILRKDIEWIQDFHTTMEAMFRYIDSYEHKDKEALRLNILCIEMERDQLFPTGKAALTSHELAGKLKNRFKSHYEKTNQKALSKKIDRAAYMTFTQPPANFIGEH